jgi:hypothetical protein
MDRGAEKGADWSTWPQRFRAAGIRFEFIGE